MDESLKSKLTQTNSVEENIEILLEKWPYNKETLSKQFRNRDQSAIIAIMEESIQELITFLFWSNGKDVPGVDQLYQEIEELEFKPININERLEFIRSKPGLHHSFIQLSQLFSEHEKQYRKSKLLKKLKKNNAHQ